MKNHPLEALEATIIENLLESKMKALRNEKYEREDEKMGSQVQGTNI